MTPTECLALRDRIIAMKGGDAITALLEVFDSLWPNTDDPDQEVNGADFIEAVSGILEDIR